MEAVGFKCEWFYYTFIPLNEIIIIGKIYNDYQNNIFTFCRLAKLYKSNA